MPFIAKNKQTGDRVNILEYQNPREEFQKGDLVCLFCDGELIIVAGFVRMKHFRHRQNSPCKSDYGRHPESYEHLFFKKLLSEKLSQESSEYLNAEPILEYPIPEAKRIADIAFQFPNGWLVVHEVQLSSITTEELQKCVV